MKAIRYVLTVFALIVVAWGSIWYFFGKTKVTATFDGAPLKGALVYVDDKWVGKTPYETRLTPGYHKIEVRPPDEYDTAQPEFTLYMVTLGRGTKFKASFDPRQDEYDGHDPSSMPSE